MEFVSLRSLQRGEQKVWETLKHENGRIVLTNNSQPAYLLVDLEGQSIIPLINWIDYYRSDPELLNIRPPLQAEQTLTPAQKTAAENFLHAVRTMRNEGLSKDDKDALAALESGQYRTGFDREPEL
jgi:hypothetical protein